MKFPWAVCAAILGSSVPLVGAVGERGSAERVLIYTAYLAEEMLHSADPAYIYTIAPGCLGTRAGRCNLDELIEHIYAPTMNAAPGSFTTPSMEPGKTTGIENPVPRVSQLDNFKFVFEKVNQARFNINGKLVKVNGWTFNSNLCPDIIGAGGDYYEILANMGTKISAARDARGTHISADEAKILDLGKLSSKITTELRWKDTEPFRIKAFNADTSLGVVVETKQIKSSFTAGRDFSVIDVEATINKYQATIPDIEDRLRTAQSNYANDPGPKTDYSNRAHMKAINAARDSAIACGCVLDTTLGRLAVKRDKGRYSMVNRITV
ncbi:hypothetical protein GQ53DRAFT_864136 [Thozetella sp. PMI_491]|nr:hypothetical protein GQ53DRAFT_864136 [Thozetella sp. PMI_491]